MPMRVGDFILHAMSRRCVFFSCKEGYEKHWFLSGMRWESRVGFIGGLG